MAFEVFKMYGSILMDSSKAEESMHRTEKKASGLSNVIGKVGIAAAAAGAAVLTGLGAALVSGTRDAIEAEEKIAQLEAVLASTGGVAGMTKDNLLALAQGFEETTKFSAESVIEAQSLLLTFTKIGSDVFPRATQAAADMATAMGTDMAGQSIALGKALNDPIAGVASLTRVGVQFTDEQKNAIKSMVEMGDVAGAQGIILTELETQFGGSAEAAGKTFGGQLEILKNAFGGVKEELAMQFMPILQQLMDWVIAHMPEIQAFMQTAFNVISIAVSTLYEWFNTYLLPIFKDLFAWVTENWPGISKVFKVVFDAIGIYINTVITIVQTLRTALASVYGYVTKTFLKIKGYFEDVFESIGETIQGVTDKISRLIEKAQKAASAVKNFFGGGTTVASDHPKYQYANGTDYHPGGMALVGERGPEIVNLPRGSSVTPNHKLGGVTINLNGANIMDDYGVDRMMDRIMDRLAVAGVS